jgi:AcrR family transcriptional regulator
MAVQKVRTRLSPTLRKNQLLDTAKLLIMKEALQRFTMEALSRTAGVTSPLVYKYFSSRETLLQVLLGREYSAFSGNLSTKLSGAKNFTEVLHIFIVSNFDHHAPGNILPALLNEPDIAIAIEKDVKKGRRQTASYLVKNAAGSYKLTKTQAGLLVSMTSGLSIAAAAYYNKSKIDREQCIETAMTYALAGLEKTSQLQQ